ncbi:MAG: translation initiation factor IF-2 [Acetobacteraceae bacterium]|nr:translation initiation factor IF-2 [Acetobacteraceae bacterium]
MSDTNDTDAGKGRLSLRPATRSDVGRTVDAGSVRQSFSHGRSKVVQVEVRKKRTPTSPPPASSPPPSAPSGTSPNTSASGATIITPVPRAPANGPRPGGRALTATELAVRARVLQEQQRDAARREQERREQEKISILSAAEEARRREEEARKAAEEEAKRAAEAAKREAAEALQQAREQEQTAANAPQTSAPVARETTAPAAPGTVIPRPSAAARPATPGAPARPAVPGETLRLKPSTARPGEEDEPRRRPGAILPGRKPGVAAPKKVGDDRRRAGRIDVQAAIEGDDDKSRSLASVRRQRERERRQAELEALRSDQVKVVRDVVLPETLTVQDLAARMAARMPDVIKALMRMGVMTNPAATIDADTAELVVQEFGHRVRRVSDSDVEIGIDGEEDVDTELKPRPPVVTIMGHVDHGKTSLLDALRSTDVAGGEAGGITQHIGAYTVTTKSGNKITFIDTPGHEAFTAMRSRGASVTDIVVLVVAADDGVMPQTIEAIRHAKAADAPIIVAINKSDKVGANPARVRQELLSHDVVVEEMGGDTQDVEVSATKRTGLDKLEEAIMLQSEILELRANPDRAAEGAVIESRLDRGRGPVATMLVQKGTLRQGEIVVAGAEWGKIRAMLDDKGQQVKVAGPSTPVEILGLSSVPSAGEPFVAVENESRAREISEFRQNKIRARNAAGATAARGTLEEMLARAVAGELKEVALVIKSDVQGSAEALTGAVQKLSHEEVNVRVLISAVGQITESDVQLAKASSAVIIGFNVRATAQARELAQRDGVDIRYYSIIYDVADDVEKLVRGKVAPKARENFLGYAEVRKVFDITKTGKVAGCYITEGLVKRGAGVRLLRDGVVIHNGQLSQLKRFKDDVREVARGYECGLSFAGYNDLKEGDVVECFEVEMVPG